MATMIEIITLVFSVEVDHYYEGPVIDAVSEVVDRCELGHGHLHVEVDVDYDTIIGENLNVLRKTWEKRINDAAEKASKELEVTP